MYSKLSENIISLQAYSYYKEFFPVIKRWLILSRVPVLKYNGLYLRYFQNNFLVLLLKVQKNIRGGKKLLSECNDLNENIFLEKTLQSNIELARVIQTIADGVAWRNLLCNRPIIRLLSDNDSSGHVNELDVKVAFSLYRGKGDVLIVNDLTRCCRISDFTCITKDKRVILYEVKTKKEKKMKIKDRNSIIKEVAKFKRVFTNQEKRHVIAQDSIIENKIEVPIFTKDGKIVKDLSVPIVNVDIHIRNHFKKVKQLIKKANKTGQAFSLVEDGYFVIVKAHDTCYNKLASISDSVWANELKKELDDKTPEWVKKTSPIRIKYSSYMSFYKEKGQFTRNILPFSVLPFSATDCNRLMFGALEIVCYVNLDTIKKRFLDVGWDVENGKCLLSLIDNKYLKPKESKERVMMKKELNDCIYEIHIKDNNGTYFTEILFTEIMIMLSSFYSIDYLLDTKIFLVQRKNINKSDKNSMVAANHVREKKILK